MANDVYGVVFNNVHRVTGDTIHIDVRDDEFFLRDVITPIYTVLHKVIIILLYLHTFLFYLFTVFQLKIDFI